MKMLIGGEWVDSSDHQVMEVRNSATQALVDTVPVATAEDVQRAIAIAQEGKVLWGATPVHERARILSKAAGEIDRRREELAALLTTEMGKIIRESTPEIAVAAQIYRGFGQRMCSLYGETMTEYQAGTEKDIIFTRREPLGVIACIIPFNYPVELSAQKIAAALAAGNAVIIKPASDNPLAVTTVAGILLEAGVPGSAIQVLTGSGASIGGALVESPLVDGVSLTGSTEVGITVAKSAAATLKHVFLELGGNDPYIVFEDVDIEFAVEGAVAGRVQNAGQTCCAPKRFLVQNSIREKFIACALERLKKVRTGSPLDFDTDLGSLISPRAAQTVEKQVQATLAAGARLLSGGKRYGETYFEPTLLDRVTPEMDIARDMEVFGPVIPVIGFDTWEEAVRIANNTIYGLQAGVMTNDMRLAMTTASKLQCGGVVINGSGNYRDVDQPFGGTKHSGMGREGIACTLEEMTQVKSYILKKVLL
ncbi:MAG: aldehyde dehydrogenase family protein [Candidatus Limiplasma sp.]|nr:aldehyde dehydrogenase family protein [Candidatus Limiplasma sp.]